MNSHFIMVIVFLCYQIYIREGNSYHLVNRLLDFEEPISDMMDCTLLNPGFRLDAVNSWNIGSQNS